MKSYIELITASAGSIIVDNGFVLAAYSDGNGAVQIGIESVGVKNRSGVRNKQNLEAILDALSYMMEHPGEDNNQSSVADNLRILLHHSDGGVTTIGNAVLYNARHNNFYFVGLGCDSPFTELFYRFMEEHCARMLDEVPGRAGASLLPDRPLPSGFDEVEDERFLKAIPHHKPRKDLRLRSAFDYVSSGIFVFAYTKDEEKYIHRFAEITGISDARIKEGMYEFYPYVTIQDRAMVPVRNTNWDNIISCKALLCKMGDSRLFD